MIIKRLSNRNYRFQIESNEDLLNLRYLLLNSEIRIRQKRKTKHPRSGVIKVKSEEVVIRDVFKVRARAPGVLQILGYALGKEIRRDFRKGSKFSVHRKFSPKQTARLRDLVPLSTLYFGVGDNMLEWGLIKGYRYEVLQRVPHTISVLKNLVLRCLDRCSKLKVGRSEYRCCRTFVPFLSSWTGLDWAPLSKDVMLQGHELTRQQIQQQEFLGKIVRLKDHWVSETRKVLKELERANLRKVYYNVGLEPEIYQKLSASEVPMEELPITAELRSVLPEGVLGISYINFREE